MRERCRGRRIHIELLTHPATTRMSERRLHHFIGAEDCAKEIDSFFEFWNDKGQVVDADESSEWHCGTFRGVTLE
jgi:hypothetical protein